MICTTCGAENLDSGVSCHTCGMLLPEPVSAEFESASRAAAQAAVNAAAQSAKRNPRRLNASPAASPAASPRQASRIDSYQQTEFFGEHARHSHSYHDYASVTLPRTRTLSEEVNESAIMIVLALVFFGILGVSGLGVYLNLPDTEAGNIRKQFVAYWNGLNTRSEPVPAALVGDPAATPLPYTPPQQMPVSAPPAPTASPYPAQTMAALDKAIAPSEPVTPEPAVETAPAVPDSEITPIRRPEKSSRHARRTPSADSETHTVSFKRFFGPEVERRTYSSESMKLRAQWLWDTEAKILEPDGSINTKYALKPASFSPIPGH